MLHWATINPSVSLHFKAESVWTYFNALDEHELPSPEELFKVALSLYDNYSTPKAATMFMSGCQLNGSVVSIGEAWREEEDAEPKPVPAEADDMDTEPVGGEDEGKECLQNKKDVASVDFDGDHTLMRSALFMYEALVSKEVAQAVAEGDIGRVYEGIKVCYQLDSHLSLLTRCSSCCSRLRGPRTTSIPVTYSTQSRSWKLMLGRSYGTCSCETG